MFSILNPIPKIRLFIINIIIQQLTYSSNTLLKTCSTSIQTRKTKVGVGVWDGKLGNSRSRMVLSRNSRSRKSRFRLGQISNSHIKFRDGIGIDFKSQVGFGIPNGNVYIYIYIYIYIRTYKVTQSLMRDVYYERCVLMRDQETD